MVWLVWDFSCFVYLLVFALDETEGVPRWDLVHLKCSECEGEARRAARRSPEVDRALALVSVQGLGQARLSFDLKFMNSATSRKSCHRLPVTSRGRRPASPLASSEPPVGRWEQREDMISHQAGRPLDASVLHSGLECRREGLRPPG